MTERPGYCDLKEVTTDAMIDLMGAVDNGLYLTFLRWAVRGYTTMKLHVLSGNKSVKLTPVENPYCVVLPDDFASFVAIGVNLHGKFIRFEKDGRIASTTSELCGNEIQSGDESQTSAPNTYYVNNYSYTYKVEEDNNRILLRGYPVLGEVVLIYVSSGIKIGEPTIIPIKVREALISFIHWQYTSFKVGATGSEKAERFARWQMESNKLKRLRINATDLYDMYINKVITRY